MITVISPAKNMRIPSVPLPLPLSEPELIENTKKIMATLKQYDPWALKSLMKLNEKLAEDCWERNITMKFDTKGTAAIETYHGIQYKYLNPSSFTPEERIFANEHLRILSAVYGILKPYDSIYEYRLEMQTKLAIDPFANLYQFWNSKIYTSLISDDKTILNLASEEYGKCIKKYLTKDISFLTCTFQVFHKGSYKTLATQAKMARGLMVNFIIRNRINSFHELKNFSENGYRFEPSLSSASEFIFLKEPSAE